MKYCVKCGKELCDEAVVCTGCGCSTDYNNTNNTSGKDSVSPQDKSSFGFGILGFFVPLAGLILYIVYRDEMPLRAKSSLIGAIVGVVVNIVLYIAFSFLYSFLFTLIFGSLI